MKTYKIKSFIKVERGHKYQVGDVLYSVYPDDEGKCEMDTWVIRTIRGGWVFAVQKVPYVTWVKLSRKNGDYGWRINIPSWLKERWFYGKKSTNLSRTKKGAWKHLLKRCKQDGLYMETDELADKVLKTARRMAEK